MDRGEASTRGREEAGPGREKTGGPAGAGSLTLPRSAPYRAGAGRRIGPVAHLLRTAGTKKAGAVEDRGEANRKAGRPKEGEIETPGSTLARL